MKVKKTEKKKKKNPKNNSENDYKFSLNFFRIFSQCIFGFGFKRLKLIKLNIPFNHFSQLLIFSQNMSEILNYKKFSLNNS